MRNNGEFRPHGLDLCVLYMCYADLQLCTVYKRARLVVSGVALLAGVGISFHQGGSESNARKPGNQ
jgi:hypothetical protein